MRPILAVIAAVSCVTGGGAVEWAQLQGVSPGSVRPLSKNQAIWQAADGNTLVVVNNQVAIGGCMFIVIHREETKAVRYEMVHYSGGNNGLAYVCERRHGGMMGVGMGSLIDFYATRFWEVIDRPHNQRTQVFIPVGKPTRYISDSFESTGRIVIADHEGVLSFTLESADP